MGKSAEKPADRAPVASGKLNIWQRLLFAYRWMSLRNKIALWSVLAVILLAALSFQWLRPAYRAGKMFYFLRQAEKYVERRDYTAASVAYRKALQSGHERVEGWKSLAKFLEIVDSPEVITVYERLAKMEPDVRDHQHKRVAAAIKFGRGYEAQAALNHMPESWKNDPEYLRNLAKVLVEKNQLSLAEQVVRRLLEARPNDEQATFQLALILSKSPDAAVRYDACRKLEEIGKQDSPLSVEAYRRLIAIAVEQNDLAEADRLATKLVELPMATTADRLSHAQLEIASRSLSAPATLQALRSRAEAHPEEFSAILDWFLVNKIEPQAIPPWLENLPPDVAKHDAVQTGLLQYHLQSADFPRVFQILRRQRAGMEISPRILDLAEKALRTVDDNPVKAGRIWLDAVYKSQGSAQTLYWLAQIATAKQWDFATSQALTALAESAAGHAAVWNLLAKHESSVGNLPGYYKALSGLMKINPYDIHVASDWVIAAVLLRKSENKAILDIAKRTYDATEPADPWAGTAYAMALLRDRRPQMALQIMNRMSEINRRQPQRAVYVGAVLAASGHKEAALEYFKRSEELGSNNFPEEFALREIWKNVAMGAPTSDEELDRILSFRKDLTKESSRVSAEIRRQLTERRDPDEVSRILAEIRAVTKDRDGALPADVQKMLDKARQQARNPAPPATATPTP